MRLPNQPSSDPEKSSYPGYPRYPGYPGYPGASSSSKDGGGSENRLDPRDYLYVIISRWWVVLLVLLAGAGAGVAYCYLAKPVYRATCRYEVYQEASLDIGKGSSYERLNARMGRHILHMRSRGLNQQVRTELAEEWGDRLPAEDRSVTLKIDTVDNSYGTMLDLTVDAHNEEYAQDYLDLLIQRHKEMRRESAEQANSTALTNLRSELKRLSAKFKDAQEAVLHFRQENNIPFTEAKEQVDEAFLANLVKRENALRMERTMLESQFEFLKDADAATIQDVMSLTAGTHQATSPNPSLRPQEDSPRVEGPLASQAAILGQKGINEPVNWRNQAAVVKRLEAEYQDQLKLFRPSHPDMVALKSRLDRARRELTIAAETGLDRLHARHKALKLQEEALERAAKRWHGALQLSTAKRAEYESLISRQKHFKDLHDKVFNRILDLTATDVDPQYSRIVEPIRALGVVWPDKFKVMLAATVAALAAGVGLAFVMDYLDTAIADLMSVEERLGIRHLASIPAWNRVLKGVDVKNQTLVVTREKSSMATEAYRALRTLLAKEIGDRDGTGYVLLITAHEAAEGKTFTSANLAVSFAWTGQKVLLVDADLRRGSLHKVFDVEKGRGLTNALGMAENGKDCSWRDVRATTEHENLDLLPVGKYDKTAPEAFSGGRFRTMVNEWRQEYDVIIMDSAPVGRVADTLAIAGIADGVMMVARPGTSGFSDARHAVRRMEGANIIGFCVNMFELPSSPYGRKYGYYYPSRYKYYKYGYNYSYGYPTVREAQGESS